MSWKEPVQGPPDLREHGSDWGGKWQEAEGDKGWAEDKWAPTTSTSWHEKPKESWQEKPKKPTTVLDIVKLQAEAWTQEKKGLQDELKELQKALRSAKVGETNAKKSEKAMEKAWRMAEQ